MTSAIIISNHNTREKKQRFQFLEKLYESMNGSSSGIAMRYELGQELNFERNTTSNVVEYLTGELLIA